MKNRAAYNVQKVNNFMPMGLWVPPQEVVFRLFPNTQFHEEE
jgi:hypothetical protein